MKRLLSVFSMCVDDGARGICHADPDAVHGQWYSSGKEIQNQDARKATSTAESWCG